MQAPRDTQYVEGLETSLHKPVSSGNRTLTGEHSTSYSTAPLSMFGERNSKQLTATGIRDPRKVWPRVGVGTNTQMTFVLYSEERTYKGTEQRRFSGLDWDVTRSEKFRMCPGLSKFKEGDRQFWIGTMGGNLRSSWPLPLLSIPTPKLWTPFQAVSLNNTS